MQLGGSLIETRIIPLELVCMEVLPPPQLTTIAISSRRKEATKDARTEPYLAWGEPNEIRIDTFPTRMTRTRKEPPSTFWNYQDFPVLNHFSSGTVGGHKEQCN